MLTTLGACYEQTDRFRRCLGGMMEVAWGPRRTAFRTARAGPGYRLRDYNSQSESGPALVLVPAPIKSADIWDLMPATSVVRRCREQGFRVYLVEWIAPREEDWGLAQYADRFLLECLDSVFSLTAQRRVLLAAHSLGGTLATIFAALHPDRVGGLVLLASPLHFGPEVGSLDRLVAAAPRAETLTRLLGNVPGSLLSEAAFAADPLAFGYSRCLDAIISLADPDAIRLYLSVECWTLQEMPLARRLFEEIVEKLYREDHFLRGTLEVGGRRAAPESVRAPMLCVVDPLCSVVPPEAVIPFLRASGSMAPRILRYQREPGVCLQHVGMLVGRRSHARLWPAILGWMVSVVSFSGGVCPRWRA